MTAVPKQKMTVDEYLPWAMAQTSGRYELVQGEIIAQSAERVAHNLGKAAIYRVLRDAVKRAGLPCTVFTDGMTVKIDQHTAREPDAAVQCGTTIDPNSIVLDTPIIVVEVISPSSIRDDSGAKLAEYFSVPSIQHYLILDPFRPVLIHHARGEAGAIATRLHTDGMISLTPPGLDLNVADVLTSG